MLLNTNYNTAKIKKENKRTTYSLFNKKRRTFNSCDYNKTATSTNNNKRQQHPSTITIQVYCNESTFN